MLILVHYYSGTGQNREKYGASACGATAGKVKQTRNPSALGSRSSDVPSGCLHGDGLMHGGGVVAACFYSVCFAVGSGEGPRLLMCFLSGISRSWVSDRNHWKFLPQGTFNDPFGSISHASTGVFRCLEPHFLFL